MEPKIQFLCSTLIQIKNISDLEPLEIDLPNNPSDVYDYEDGGDNGMLALEFFYLLVSVIN